MGFHRSSDSNFYEEKIGMKKLLISISTLAVLFSCEPLRKKADAIYYNATFYTIDSTFSTVECIVVQNGKIIDRGNSEKILSEYDADTNINLNNAFVYPGFIDAHCHFYNYGLGLNQIDLVGTKSFSEVLKRVTDFSKVSNSEWIIGRGWDQNDWEQKNYPDNKQLDSLFPDRPVVLHRIDGHAAIANSRALTLTGMTVNKKISGGLIESKNGKATGILIDNAVDSLTAKIPKPSVKEMELALRNAEKNCLAVGLTTVDDAGLDKAVIDLIQNLQSKGKLSIRIYAMITSDQKNLDYYLSNGKIKTDLLNVSSFKFYADGALGSRGACMLKDYSDKPGWKGFLLNTPEHYRIYARQLADKGFQMNTHCIGDSSMRMILKLYANTLKGKKDCRWRIEHCQCMDSSDFKFFSDFNIIPSIQPTHATSDMYWAEKRLGENRIKYAYAYKQQLNYAGIVALGTDFPVEDINPINTFFAAVFRKDANLYPSNGFQTENGLTREEALKGITIWAAYSNFEEKEKGSLENGKFADMVVLDRDLMKANQEEIRNTKVLFTIIDGKVVYKKP